MKLSEIISSPTYPVIIPSTKKATTFRPFLIKEEKALLAAQESEDQMVMLSTLDSIVKQCVAKCPDNLMPYDLEYLFTHIRSKSVGEYSDLIMRCRACDDPKAKKKMSIDLRKAAIRYSDKHVNKIQLSEKVVCIMKDPGVSDLIEISQEKDQNKVEIMTMKACISKVYYEDEVFELAEESEEEIKLFFDSLNGKQQQQLEEYVSQLPYVAIDVEFTCPVCGHEHKEELKGISNFF